MLKVKYLRQVTSPSDRKGKVGQTRELPDRIAQRLAGEGYVQVLDGKPAATTGAKPDDKK